jgi:WD40 repeat protein
MHRRKVNAVTISRAGTRIVSGSDDGSIRVWDVEGCGLVACIVNGRNTVQGLCISGDGQRVVAASQSWNSGTTLRVWDIATRSRVADLKGEQRAVWAVALVAGERRVVAACKFGFLRVYDLDHYMCLSPATSTCAPAEIIGNESVQVLPSRGPQSESSTVQEAYAWGLQFRLRHRPTDLPGVDSATSPGFTTLHVRAVVLTHPPVPRLTLIAVPYSMIRSIVMVIVMVMVTSGHLD